MEGVDTDQLIPARFMSRSRDEGYCDQLLYDLRRNDDGSLRPDFPLNLPLAEPAKILVTRRNFGCGSSREAAVYALMDAGFRAVIAPSFGDIFATNAVNNGLLPATVGEDVSDALMAACAQPSEMTVCTQTSCIRARNLVATFQLDPTSRQKLINGWDDIDMTLSLTEAVQAFETTYQRSQPWGKRNGR